MDGLVSQGAALLEVLEQTKNLAARRSPSDTASGNGAAPAAGKVLPPPDAAALAQLSAWNQA